MGKLVVQVQVGLLVSVLGNGCSLVPNGEPVPSVGTVQSGGTVACVDWVQFKSPQDQYDHAGAVLIGKSVSRAGETSIYGYKATTHLVEVGQVLKGDPGNGTLRISSMPPTCTAGGSYPDGDPLDADQRVLIFATKHGGEWFTMTPSQGVLPSKKVLSFPFTSVSPAEWPLESA